MKKKRIYIDTSLGGSSNIIYKKSECQVGLMDKSLESLSIKYNNKE